MQLTLRNTLTFLLVAFVLIGNSFADNWHQWRGPNNDGISQATDAPHPLESDRKCPMAFATPWRSRLHPCYLGRQDFPHLT